ncbi:pantoate--beta-alanine ligase [Clostridium oryzae]|uniref:Pantothenate synthetase n=1 Tax=Clostridium oryzae TaxID=1450648 RepID=A0A1V4IMN3_9CLOT|nr:pantoate--beta-alanine ligase [Clostridium oryzae]OPJ61298.1 pantothenate synthetase [Clostridium oryzae]
MKIVNTPEEVRKQVALWKKEGFSVGLVPTMGFLHEGHGSLIKKASEENDKVVVSVFVNPIQFGPSEDLASYPRDLKHDTELVSECGGDMIFSPSPSDMYCEDFCSFVDVENLTSGLCGAKRPGHFRGVCTVVTKLFNIVQPERAYFGQKDAQQLAVIKRMVRDLNVPVTIVPCPIVREADGLAKSSRNTYLSSEERKAAVILNKSLKKGLAALTSGERNAEVVKNIIKDTLNSEPLAKIDYVEIVDSSALAPVTNINSSILTAIAVYIGKTRLIDNFTFNL